MNGKIDWRGNVLFSIGFAAGISVNAENLLLEALLAFCVAMASCALVDLVGGLFAR